jgi:hypothetical protein
MSGLKQILLQDSSVQHGFVCMKQVCNCEVVQLGICLLAQGPYGCDHELLGPLRNMYVKSSGIFGFVTPYSTVGGYRHVGGTCCLHLQGLNAWGIGSVMDTDVP